VFGVALTCAVLEGDAVQAQGAAEEYTRDIENAVLEFDSGNWAEARVSFEQAHARRPSARTLRGMGKASFELKDYVRAQRELSSSLTELRSPLSDSQRDEIAALLSRVDKFVGLLKVHVKPASAKASVMIDGARVDGSLKLNLGQHELSVQADGYQSLNRTISIEGAKRQHLELTLNSVQPESNAGLEPKPEQELKSVAFTSEAATNPQPSDQPSTGVLQQWWFWTIVGVVVVGGAAAAVALTTQTVPDAPAPGNTGLAVQVLTFAH
jgi:hypothetical protein